MPQSMMTKSTNCWFMYRFALPHLVISVKIRLEINVRRRLNETNTDDTIAAVYNDVFDRM